MEDGLSIEDVPEEGCDASESSPSALAVDALMLRRLARPSSFLFLRSLIVVSARPRRASLTLTDPFTDLLTPLILFYLLFFCDVMNGFFIAEGRQDFAICAQGLDFLKLFGTAVLHPGSR